MKKIYLLFCLFVFTCTIVSAREITDMAGRTVIIPDELMTVMPYDNKTNILLFPVAKEKMIVKARAKVSPDLKFITKEYLKIKEIDTRNAEEVLKIAPDAIIVGAFVDDKLSLSTYTDFAERIKIPLIIVDLELTHLDETYQFLGSLLKCDERASKYVSYIRSIYNYIDKLNTDKTQGRAYLANETNGLRTAPAGSRHAQIFEIMNIDNVAISHLNANGFGIVSMEQILVWNPDFIFCLGKGEKSPYRTVLKSALWRSVNAVQKKHVYVIPSEPYPWFDMPPSVNRLLGLIWFSEIFYGQDHEITKQKIKEFYHFFYSYELSDKEYENLFLWQ